MKDALYTVIDALATTLLVGTLLSTIVAIIGVLECKEAAYALCWFVS